MTELDFNTIVLASRDPEVQALWAIPATDPTRYQEGLRLANEGKILDYDIDVLGQSAYFWMNYREELGYKWTPSALQTPSTDTSVYTIAPGPKDSIPTSTDPASYPPYVKPGNPVPAPGTKWVRDDVVVSNAPGQPIQYAPTDACRAQQGSTNPIPNGMEHVEEDANGHTYIYHAAYPTSPRALPGWILWQRQNP